MKNDNRGVALISILIAVAFISIIGSALLYISYVNFQMKVQNVYSRNNFYETDGELVRITSSLRNYADKPSTVDPLITGLTDNGDGTYTGTIDMTNILTACALPTTGSYQKANADGTYDTFTYDVTHTVIKAEPNSNVTTYTIKDFSVQQKSHDGYVNKVQTDIKLNFLKQSSAAGGRKGLGECSMISDASMTMMSFSGDGGDSFDDAAYQAWFQVHGPEFNWQWEYGKELYKQSPEYNQSQSTGSATDFDFMTLLGDSYFSSYYYGADDSNPVFDDFPGSGTPASDKLYTMPGKFDSSNPENSSPALAIGKDCKINFDSDYMAVYGDLVLTGKSTLIISKDVGNLTVYGDIYVLDDATLICNGTIFQPESILPGRVEKCAIYSNSGKIDSSSADWKKHIYYKKSVQPVTDTSFKGFCELLKLNTNGKDDDGVTNKIVNKITYYNKDSMPNNVEFDIIRDDLNFDDDKISVDYYGKPCGLAFARGGAEVVNVDAYENYILFVNSGKDGKMAEVRGSTVNTTLVSSCPIHLDINCGAYFSKMGSEIYDFLTVKKNDTTNPYYNANIHSVKLGITGDASNGTHVNSSKKDTGLAGTKNQFSAGDILADDTNTTIINLFTAGINGGSGMPTYINSISYKGYVKDAD